MGPVLANLSVLTVFPSVLLCFQCTEVIYSEMLEQSYAMDAVKLCLVVGHTDMFPPAIDVLSKLEQVTDSVWLTQ